jgi:histidinol-phosphate aminotransferase
LAEVTTEAEATVAGGAPQPVPWLATAAPAVHGSFDESAAASLGLNPAEVLDFSTNGNVIGPPAAVMEALSGIDLSRYPDRGAGRLRTRLAKHHDVPEERVLLGNGSTELIWSIARAFLAPGDPTLVVGPTYGEYEAACAACGVQVETCLANRPGVGVDADLLSRDMAVTRPSIVWMCHPNNPTGMPLPLDDVQNLAQAHPTTLFVVDEAYLALCEDVPSAVPLGLGNVVALRSMTKDCALAGVRVGYAIGSEPVVEAIRRVVPPWTVNSVAQAAALIALEHPEHLEQARRAVAASRAHLFAGLERIGCRPYPSITNFVLVPVGDAARVTDILVHQGFAVRDCTSFGLPDCIRIGVRAIAEQERLLATLVGIHDG